MLISLVTTLVMVLVNVGLGARQAIAAAGDPSVATLQAGAAKNNETTRVRCGSNGFKVVDFFSAGGALVSKGIPTSDKCTPGANGAQNGQDPGAVANNTVLSTQFNYNPEGIAQGYGFNGALGERGLLELVMTYFAIRRAIWEMGRDDDDSDDSGYAHGVVMAVIEAELERRGIDPARVRQLGPADMPRYLTSNAPTARRRDFGALPGGPRIDPGSIGHFAAAGPDVVGGLFGVPSVLGRKASFRLDLNDLRRRQLLTDLARADALGVAAPADSADRFAGALGLSRLNAWLDGAVTGFDDQGASGTAGHVYSLAGGISYLLEPGVTVAAALRYRNAESERTTTRHEGDYFGAALIASASVGMGVLVDLVAAYEHGENTLTVAGASGDFDSDTLTFGLSAHKRFWLENGMWLEPTGDIGHGWADRARFTNTAGTRVPGADLAQGQARIGLGAGMAIATGEDELLSVEPHGSIRGVWEFVRENAPNRAGVALNGGLKFHFAGHRHVAIAGNYLALGETFESWGARAEFRMPLN